MVEHTILGGIVSVLFYTMCNYGLENINWILLACIPIIMFIKWVYTPPPYYDECNECNECDECDETVNVINPVNISKPVNVNNSVNTINSVNANNYITSKKTRNIWESTKEKELNCPARPLKLPTTCGISRYY